MKRVTGDFRTGPYYCGLRIEPAHRCIALATATAPAPAPEPEPEPNTGDDGVAARRRPAMRSFGEPIAGILAEDGVQARRCRARTQVSAGSPAVSGRVLAADVQRVARGERDVSP